MKAVDATLKAAEQVVEVLENHGVEAVLIGALALAAYHYVRFTEDLDLGIEVEPASLATLAEALREGGFPTILHLPDGDDPLGGVIDVAGPWGLIQIVNFGNRFPAAIRDALGSKEALVTPGGHLKVAPLPQLVALKLYAGGLKSKIDIIEVLRRNPTVDLGEIQATCRRYRLRGLGALLKELEE